MPARQPVISVTQGIVWVTGRASRGSARSQDRRDRRAALARARSACVHSGLSGALPGPGARRSAAGRAGAAAGTTLGIGMPSAAASWASVVCQFSQVAQAPLRTWLTFCSGRLVIALASRYPAAVVCGPPPGGVT